MQLKHNHVKKEQTGGQVNRQPNAANPRAFASVALLASGLALFASGQAKADKGPENLSSMDCRCTLPVKTIVQVVKAGDDLVKNGVLPNSDGTSSLLIAMIGTNGVTIEMETFATSQTIELPYDTTNRVGEFCISQSIRAEKGDEPGTARITMKSTDVEAVAGAAGDKVDNLMECTQPNRLVKVGDAVITFDSGDAHVGYSGWTVTNMDDKGIEVSPTKPASGRKNPSSGPTKIAYGETVQLDGPSLHKVTVHAWKGQTPGTASIDVTANVPGGVSGVQGSNNGLKKTSKAKLDCGSGSAVNMVCKADKSVLKVGDPVLTVEFVFEKTGVFTWNITKIDARGIEVNGSMAMFMLEQAISTPFRVNFNEAQAFGGPGFGAVIKAKKGPKPKTAIVTVGFQNNGYTELKQTSARLVAPAADTAATDVEVVELK